MVTTQQARSINLMAIIESYLVTHLQRGVSCVNTLVKNNSVTHTHTAWHLSTGQSENITVQRAALPIKLCRYMWVVMYTIGLHLLYTLHLHYYLLLLHCAMHYFTIWLPLLTKYCIRPFFWGNIFFAVGRFVLNRGLIFSRLKSPDY